MSNNNDIFISYSRKNLEQVKRFKEEIERLTNAHCWLDLDGIESGAPQFTKVIIDAINACPIFLFMLSKESQKSENALKELNFAYNKYREEGKKVVIVYIEKCKMTDEFSFEYGKADTIDWHNSMQHDKLVRDIRLWIWKPIDDKKCEVKHGGVSTWVTKFGVSTHYYKFIGTVLCIIIAVNLVIYMKSHISFNSNSNITIIADSEKCIPVDLGLPSGTLWGDRNIGAKKPVDFGDLFAWGEVSPKSNYSRYAYVEQLMPYDNITNSKHDAAMAELGGEWSIPTEAQFNELLSVCQWIWKKIDGINGYEVVGKNGNRIFLPAAGWNCDTTFQYRNKYGYYWTSERSSINSQFARNLQFPKNGKGVIGNGYLYVGRSIRAVYVSDAVAE